MTSIRSLSIRAASLAVLLAASLPAIASAQRLAALNRTPENAVAVISVNDPGTLYAAASRSAVPALIEGYIAGVPGLAESLNTFREDQSRIEGTLGYRFDGGSVFRSALRGADFYVLRHELNRRTIYSTAAVLAFNDPAQALNTLTQILDELKSASGSVGPIPASMMTLSQVRSQPFHIFPAFGLCVANVGDLLIVASSERAMREVLSAEGRDRLLGNVVFTNTMGQLAGVPGQIWAYGERGILSWQLLRLGLMPEQPGAPFSLLDRIISSDASQRIGIIVEVSPSAIKTTRFVPAADFDSADRALVALADDGPLHAAEWLPATASIAYASTNMDLRAVVNAEFEEIARGPNGEAHAEEIRGMLEDLREDLGFSFVEDLLGQVDLDFGFSWTAPGTASGKWLVVARVADAARARRLQTALEEAIGDRGTVTSSEHRGTTVQVATTDTFAPLGGTVASAVSNSGWLVLACCGEEVRAALDREVTKSNALTRSPRWTTGLTYLSRGRHSVWVADMEGAAALASRLITEGRPRRMQDPAIERIALSMINSAGALGVAYTGTTYTAEGIRSEQVIVANEAIR